ncbi:MAG: MATE family efflux transporter [Candidatus Hydrogenedentes bacterium]|nr:MATE family efflux transporter [Candidatus Hydrogenedentota bacterium]
MPGHDLTNDPIPQLFARLAIPASVGYVFHTLYNVTDTWFAGRLGEVELAALGLTFPVFFIIVALGAGLSQGGTALISNALGEGKQALACTYGAQAIGCALLVTLVSTVLGLAAAPALFRMLGAQGRYLETALQYSNVLYLGSFAFFVVFVFSSILSAHGDTKSYRNVLIAGFCLNWALNPLFMYGVGPIPALGVGGIALATVASQSIGAAYLLRQIIRAGGLKDRTPRDFFPRAALLRDIFKQGAPPSLNMFTVALGIFVITYFLSGFGPDAVAAYGVATRIEQIFLLPSIGINVAVLALVGQNNGARRFDRVHDAYYCGLRYGFFLGLSGGVLLFIGSRPLVAQFTDSNAVADIAIQYLQIAAFLPFCYSLLFSTVSALQGLKKPIYALWVGLIRQIIAPAVFFGIAVHVLRLGLLSIWLSIAIIVSSAAGIMFLIGRHHIARAAHLNQTPS